MSEVCNLIGKEREFYRVPKCYQGIPEVDYCYASEQKITATARSAFYARTESIMVTETAKAKTTLHMSIAYSHTSFDDSFAL